MKINWYRVSNRRIFKPISCHRCIGMAGRLILILLMAFALAPAAIARATGSAQEPRKHTPHPLRTHVLLMSDRPPPGLAKLMPSISDPRAADAEESSAPLDPPGWASLAAGLLVALITFFTSYSHVNLFGFLQFKVDQQIGIPLLLTAMAAVVGEDEVFSVGVVKLASNNRCADQRARERAAKAADRQRYRAAAEREQTARRYRIQARCLVAQC
jgi:hypothetical protein